MNKNIGIALLVITVLAVGFVALSINKKEEAAVLEMAKSDMAQDEKSNDDALINSVPVSEVEEPKVMINNAVTNEGINQVSTAGAYQAYDPEKIAMAATGDVVIFFHASWCPSCRGLNADIEENSADIPEGLFILKADYDKETDLKKKYGVTTQHTLVQVDKDGNLIKKWSGGSKLENLVSQLQ